MPLVLFNGVAVWMLWKIMKTHRIKRKCFYCDYVFEQIITSNEDILSIISSAPIYCRNCDCNVKLAVLDEIYDNSKSSDHRYIKIEHPIDCPYRLYEMGTHGCGFYGGYVSARRNLCQGDLKFPPTCPLERIEEMNNAISE